MTAPLLSRKEALAQGLTRYKGKVCAEHPELKGERCAGNGLCVECRRSRRCTENMTPEQIERRNARYRNENLTPEQIERRRARNRKENLTPEQIERNRARMRNENLTPEQVERRRAQQRARMRAENMTPEQLDRQLARRLLRDYGLSLEQYCELLQSQGYKCAICLAPVKEPGHGVPKKQVGRVDHCHKTKAVRGILCDGCNKAIGHLRDNPLAAERAKQYLFGIHDFEEAQ